ncbi:MAG: FtsW/RodA/SpoVE family cell cycle protein [Planctomycetota bacterium]
MLRPGQVVLLCALALLTLGVVMVNSAGMSVTPLPTGAVKPGAEAPPPSPGITAESILTSRAAVYMLAAVGMMAFASVMPVRKLAEVVSSREKHLGLHPLSGLWPFGLGIFVLLSVVLLVYVPGLSRTVNGATRWISVPGLGSVQPSEIAKWAVPVLIAWYGVRRAHVAKRFWIGTLPALLGIGLIAGAVVLEDLGTGLLIGVAGVLVLLAAGTPLKHIAVWAPPAAGALALAVLTSPYRVERVITFLDPYADPQGSGYHMIQSLTTVAGGGGFGRGLGHGLQKFGYLPEDTTDFLFAVVAEELGIAGAALVVFLFSTMVIALWSIVQRERSPMLKLYALGVLATIGMQAVMNLMVVTGLGPTKGIALPLVSAGGTGWVLTAISLGLVVSIDRSGVGQAADQDGNDAEAEAEIESNEPSIREVKPLRRAREAA